MPDSEGPHPPPAVNTGGGIYLTGGTQVHGGTFIGHDQITVENLHVTYQIIGDRKNTPTLDSTLGMKVFEDLGSAGRQLTQAGVESGIAVATPPGSLLTQMSQPSAAADRAPGPGSVPWSSLGPGSGAPPSGSTVGTTAEQLTRNWAEIAPKLQEMDQQLPGPVLELTVGGQRVDVAEVLIQQGNLALWRFRRAWARFYGGQVIGNFLGRLEWPYLPDFQPVADRARTDIEVLRGLALQQALPGPLSARPDLFPLLGQGQWRQVLNILASTGTVDADILRFAQTEVEEIGQPYNPDEVTAAFQQADQALNQALQRQPDSSAALVNLATLRAESALYSYVMTGVADRAMLSGAHQLFGRAAAILAQRQDPAGRCELAKCLFAAATALPPDADLDAIDVATAYAELQKAAMSRSAQQRIQWDALRRNMARQAFIDGTGIQRARDLFTACGDSGWAQHCDMILAGLQMFFANRSRQMRWAQAVWPIVGSWTYRTGNPAVTFTGMIVFNAEAEFHWLQDIQQMGAPPSRHISVGSYSVSGNAILLQGRECAQQASPQPWMPAAPGMQASFQCRLLVQGSNPGQLLLAWPEMNSQFPCLRA
jgi:hypothetical protein